MSEPTQPKQRPTVASRARRNGAREHRREPRRRPAWRATPKRRRPAVRGGPCG